MDFTSYQAESARFDEVRRGFDPAAVARFQAQAVKSLRSYERELRDVQRRLNELEAERMRVSAASDGAERAFFAGVDAKQAIIVRAEREAVELLEQARRDAASERERLSTATAGERDSVIAELEQLRAEAATLDAEMERLRAAAAAGTGRDEQALGEARRWAEEIRVAAESDAARLRADATAAAASVVDTARAEADMIVAGARNEARIRLDTADEIRVEAERAAAARHASAAEEETDRVGRERAARAEIVDLREAVRAVEEAFRAAVSEASGLLGAAREDVDRIVDALLQDGAGDGPELTVDLRPETAEPAGFYEKRLSGLRRRLEERD